MATDPVVEVVCPSCLGRGEVEVDEREWVACDWCCPPERVAGRITATLVPDSPDALLMQVGRTAVEHQHACREYEAAPAPSLRRWKLKQEARRAAAEALANFRAKTEGTANG